MDFDEPCRSSSTYFIADRAVGRNRAHESDHAITGQEICDVADSPNILVSILAAETKSPTDVLTHHVSVKQLGLDPARDQFLAQRARDGAFSCTTQPCEPHDGAAARLPDPHVDRPIAYLVNVARYNRPLEPWLITPTLRLARARFWFPSSSLIFEHTMSSPPA